MELYFNPPLEGGICPPTRSVLTADFLISGILNNVHQAVVNWWMYFVAVKGCYFKAGIRNNSCLNDHVRPLAATFNRVNFFSDVFIV